MKILTTLGLIALGLASVAQPTYHTVSNLKVYHSGQELETPWLGGLNNPLFSDIDIDDDGFKDLWVFEASEGHFYTFRNLGIADSISYVFAPEFIPNFPHDTSHPHQRPPVLHDWAWLVDYNCDGLEDIFSYHSGGAQVYRAKRNLSGELEYEFVTIQLKYQDGIYKTNIYMSSLDYPAFIDIDEDSDLDILAFPLLGDKIEFYENQSFQLGYGCDSLIYLKDCRCWGYVKEAQNTFSFALSQSCPCLTGQLPDGPGGPRHGGGSSLLPFDQDDDGDIELIVSDPGFDNVIYLHNGKTAFRDSISSQDSTFPIYNVPVDLPTFPAGALLDVNNDDFEDLLFAPLGNNLCRIMPGFQDTAENLMAVWYYEGIGPASNKQFSYQTHDFLVAGMIDIGEISHPAFFDHNADGLLDIVAGNCYSFDENEQIGFGLTLYENTGTTTSPEFTFVTEDYNGLASLQLIGMSPTFGDLDDDGDLDMVCGTVDGQLKRFENTAGAGNPALFTYLSDIDSTYHSSNNVPQLIDVDRDSLIDLLVGEEGGEIYYYRNTGTAAGPVFTRITDEFGDINVTDIGGFWGYSAPQLVADGPGGSYRLYVGSLSGRVHLYDNIDGNLAGSFDLVTKVAADTFFGARTAPAIADINTDGHLEMLLGNQRGGLIMTSEFDWTLGIISPKSELVTLAVYPVPASDHITIQLSAPHVAWWLELADVSGRVMLSRPGHGKQSVQDVSDLSPGVYMMTVTAEDFRSSTKVIIAR